MRALFACLIVIGLAACSLSSAAMYSGATWVGAEYVYDTQPLEYAAEFFGKSCEKYTIYDSPPRCRR